MAIRITNKKEIKGKKFYKFTLAIQPCTENKRE